ncbi:MAG: hypothetical protein JO257_06350 [Deltaproteobacteria bacterium]|nr:hypothetical protein [Deltaproteobacteria bacterium]
MSSLRLITKLTTSLLIACTLTSVASAEIARVPGAPVTPTAPHFAQPPHHMRQPSYDEDVAPVLTRAAVREALLEARHRNLQLFRAYQKAGVFPSNTFEPTKLNVWRDADGHFCAAATIIRGNGLTELADRVADQNNFIRLADVSQGPLMDFILTSGFTQDEIAMIQEPFDPVTRPSVRPVDPNEPSIVDARLRAAETARLRVKYRQVERALVKNEKRNLDVAVDRLMKHPDLAWKIASAE